MENFSFLIVLFAALTTPLLMARFHIANLPTAVAEILVGLILGQSVLHIVSVNATLNQMSTLGVIILLFLSGMEIDFSLFTPLPKTIKKRTAWTPLRLAFVSFGAMIVMSLLLGYAVDLTGLFHEPILAALIFSTIALGVVIAALKEKELLSQPLGQTILLIAALGEVGPLIMLTVYATIHGPHASRIWLISLIFLAAIILLNRSQRIYRFFDDIDKATTQLDIRLAFFLIFALVSVAETVGAENILGAFLAGIVMKLLRPKEDTQNKLTSIGYGFFIPIFFITTGAKLNIPALFKDKNALILIPIFLAGFILAKMPIYFVLKKRFKQTNALAGTFLTTTTITLVLPALTVGRNLNLITTAQSGAFTLAAVIDCFIFPVLFNRFYTPDPAEQRKTRVHFIGANLITVPIAQQLSKGLYEVKLYTDRHANYSTYNSEANITYLPTLDRASLANTDAFEADIMIMAYADHDRDFEFAEWALAENVPRIIARFETKDVADDQYDILAQRGVEVFNTFEANISLLRSLIEAPATFKIIDDTDSGLFEATVRNRRFTDVELRNLPFIDQITVARIYRDNQPFSPHGNTVIQLNDHLVFTGPKHVIAQIRPALEKDN